MRTHIDRLFSVSTAELCDIRNSCIVQSPEGVLVESFNSFLKADLYAVGKKIVLAKKVLLLNFLVKLGIVFFANRHYENARL